MSNNNTGNGEAQSEQGGLPAEYEYYLVDDARTSIEADLKLCREKIRDLDVQQRQIHLEIGELLRQAVHVGHALGFQQARPDVSRSADLTGLSRPKLYELRDQRGFDEADPDRNPEWAGSPARWSNEYLAQMHASYGYRGHEEIDNEFWRRYPHLGSWWALMSQMRTVAGDLAEEEYLAGVPEDRREQERQERLFWVRTAPAPPFPALDQLMQDYCDVVDQIAHSKHWPPPS